MNFLSYLAYSYYADQIYFFDLIYFKISKSRETCTLLFSKISWQKSNNMHFIWNHPQNIAWIENNFHSTTSYSPCINIQIIFARNKIIRIFPCTLRGILQDGKEMRSRLYWNARQGNTAIISGPLQALLISRWPELDLVGNFSDQNKPKTLARRTITDLV